MFLQMNYQVPHSSSELALTFFLVEELALARTELLFVDLFFAGGVEAEVGVSLPLIFSSVGRKV